MSLLFSQNIFLKVFLSIETRISQTYLTSEKSLHYFDPVRIGPNEKIIQAGSKVLTGSQRNINKGSSHRKKMEGNGNKRKMEASKHRKKLRAPKL